MERQCSTVLVEFLYHNGAKLTVCDEKGRSCLHYAALTDDASVLLLKRGDTLDSDGKDPVQIAVDQENGDVITLFSQGNDDLFPTVFEEPSSYGLAPMPVFH
jgi:ankyrin repeat protein